MDTALAALYVSHSETEVQKNFCKEIGYHSIRKSLTPSPCISRHEMWLKRFVGVTQKSVAVGIHFYRCIRRAYG